MNNLQPASQQASPTDPAWSWGMLCHLASLAFFLGIPFGNLLGPLVVWLLKRDQFPFVDDQGKESLNFQITATIAGLLACVLCFILIGIPILIAIIVADIVLVVIATVKSYKGEYYRYPYSIKFLK